MAYFCHVAIVPVMPPPFLSSQRRRHTKIPPACRDDKQSQPHALLMARDESYTIESLLLCRHGTYISNATEYS